MAEFMTGVDPPTAELQRLRWSWRWLLVELTTIAVLLVLTLVPAAHYEAVVWTALGAAAIVAIGGLIAGFGFFFYTSPIWPTFEISPVRSRRSPETLWSQLTRQDRRELRRLLRRGHAEKVPSEHRLVAWWFAARSVRQSVPQATGQTGIGALWVAMSFSHARGTGEWWLHIGAGLLFAALGVVVVWLTPPLRRSLTQLEAHDVRVADDAPRDETSQ